MRDILLEKEKLMKSSIELRNCTFKIDSDEQLMKVRKKQDEIYKKLQFYKKYIIAVSKVTNENNNRLQTR